MFQRKDRPILNDNRLNIALLNTNTNVNCGVSRKRNERATDSFTSSIENKDYFTSGLDVCLDTVFRPDKDLIE